MNPEISRRDFLILSGATLFLAACGSENKPQRETEKPLSKKLNEYVNSLPESDLKIDLQERVLPLFQNPRPASIKLGGIEVPVADSTIKTSKQNVSRYDGTARLDFDDSSKAKIEKDTIFTVPLPHFYTDEEIASSDQSWFSSEGTFLIQGTLPQGQDINDSIAPEITVTVPDRSKLNIDPDHFTEMEKSVYIKEALTVLFMLENYERIAEKMAELDINPYVVARDQNSELIEVNTITNSVNSLSKFAGRFTAITDLAGYFLMFKIFKDTKTETHLKNDPLMEMGFASVKKYLDSTDIEDTFEQAMNWALTSPDARNLSYVGDITKPY